MTAPELEKRLKNGDESALNEIITKYAKLISAVIYNLSGQTLPVHDVEELTADTFITLWYQRDKIEENKLEGFLCTIAKNKARNKIRDNKIRQVLDIDEMVLEDEFMIADSVEKEDAQKELHQALNELGEPDKEIIVRHYFYYQPSSEIGSALKLNPQTVRTKMHRAKEKLKSILKERGLI